ncbi:hypothetical protein AOT85_24435 [Mycobacteroides sp. H054]|nr:hypothetical protein AOT84_02265 [Mycobacteroides sp. H002]KRQ46031.1 hypothetical protein AOT85_24435 [Mycobacteroides sp. H054]
MARAKRTQATLAHEVGMRQQALSRRMAGHAPLSVDELARIAEALGVPITALIGSEPAASKAAS